MNRAHVKNSKIMVIRHDLSASAKWEEMVDVGFNVDEFIIKQIAYNATVAETGVYELWTNLARDGVVAAFVEGSNTVPALYVTPNIKGCTIKGKVKFAVLEGIDPQTVSTAAIGILAITIEFVEYDK